MRALIASTVLIIFSLTEIAYAGQLVRVLRNGNHVEALSAEDVQSEPESGAKVVRSLPQSLREDGPPSTEIYEEVLVSDQNFEAMGLRAELEKLKQRFRARNWPGSEVRTLRDQGPTSNRINLTIVGDGYTAAEKKKFFDDAERTTRGLFDGETFHSYLPLFNVFAVFVPSKESGLTDTRNRDTALGLYRDPPNSKRAIMVGKAGEARRAIALAPATDYSILLANDDFYGGLGGEFAITTRSEKSGMIVLRHELGHNFSNVGEEYDGGYVYRGANFSSSEDADWKYWATDKTIETYESRPLFGEYLWKNLNEGAYKESFEFPQQQGWSFDFQLSSVGWSTPDDVKVWVDGKLVALKGQFLSDRSFFNPLTPLPLGPGKHNIEIKENVEDGDNVLGSTRAWAFPPNYNFAKDVIGAFATFDDSNRKVGYRPTHESCLMRNMQIAKFCSVDQENMWLRFLERVSLIDSLEIKQTGSAKQITVSTPPLPGLEITWYQADRGVRKELPEYKNARTWQLDPQMKGQVVVRVQFAHPEIRKTSERLTSESSVRLKSARWW